MIPISVIEDDKEHAMHYSQSLPYVELLDKEAENWLNDICTNLFTCIKAKDFVRVASVSVKSLISYLDMKHALPTETRAKLAKIFYELTLMPGMDNTLVHTFSRICGRLICNKKKLGPNNLELDWHPLYEMINKTLFTKSRQEPSINEETIMATILPLAGHAKRYFSPKAAQEILTEFLPKFTIHSISDAIKAQAYLVLLLPIEYRENDTMHANDYLPTIYSLWSMIASSSIYDTQFIYLLSRIARYNLDQGNQDIGLFTKQQIQSVFTAGLTMMSLPVGSRGDGSGRGSGSAGSTGYGSIGSRVDLKADNAVLLKKDSEKFKSLAKFIVYTIIPDGTSSYSLSLLTDMIQAIELYFHPSNHGPWTYLLTSFVRYLSYEFLKRWREEQEQDCNVPQNRRLTPELRKEFVLTIRPVTYLSMFGKDHYVVVTSQAALKYLSWLEPSLIFPGILERIYPSLETLTETHRTSSALSILSDIALPLFSRDHYPSGGRHLLPLLELAIPGIDMNDPFKTITSLMFISNALISVPICDMTQSQSSYYLSPDEEAALDGNPFAELSRESEDHLVRATTGEFEEWLAKFLRRVFTIFEHLPQENRKQQGGATTETRLTQIVIFTCDIVFGQLSNELHDLALRSIVEFITDRVLPNATQAAGYLCYVITSGHPKKAAKAILPICISNIQMELEHGASSTLTHADTSNLIQSDSTLHWYQNILFSVVSNLGKEVLTYRQEIMDITRLMIQKCRTRRGIMWTGKLIRKVLDTTVNIYPREFKSLKPSQWSDKDFMSKHAHQVWGQCSDPNEIDIQWHVPSEEEKDFALAYIAEFLTPSVERLQQLMNDQDVLSFKNSHEVSNEFCRHLAIVRNCVMGSSTMVADDGVVFEDQVMEDQDSDDYIDEIFKKRVIPAGYTFSDPNDPRTQTARDIRRSIGELIHQLSEFFMKKRENDVESIKILIKIARYYLAERGVEKSQLDRREGSYEFAKNVVRTPFCKKQYPRNLLIRRAYIYHLSRMRKNVKDRARTPLHDAILLDLLEMSLCSYAEIRQLGQHAVSASRRCFNNCNTLIAPVLLKALEPNAPEDRMKGALYLFTHRSVLQPILRDWEFLPSFVMTICSAQHKDKISIQNLVAKIFRHSVSYFNEFSLRVIVPEMDSLVHTLTQANETTNKNIDLIQQKVNTQNQRSIQNYNQLIESLLEFLKDSSIHWRYATMAANYIELFIRADYQPSEKLAAFANKATLSELPSMRRSGISVTTQVLYFIKQRTLAEGNQDLIVAQKLRNPLKIDFPIENSQDFEMGRKLLDASYEGLTPENESRSILIDDAKLGWYVWPEKCYRGYKMNPKSFLFENYIEEGSKEAYHEFLKVFSSEEYWSKICSYLSQEVDQGNDDDDSDYDDDSDFEDDQDDHFSATNARLFKSIFQTFGDAPLLAAKEHIEKLCLASDQKNSQRAAAEILGGLIRGSKHWSLSKLESLWNGWLSLLLSKVLNSITPDSLNYWESFVRFCAKRRDPRRIQPLIDLILKAELDPTSDAAFNESRKLLLLRTLIVSLQWRFEPLSQKILPVYLDHLQHPYKQVREVLGANINELIQLRWIPSYPSVQYLLKENAKSDGVGNIPTTLSLDKQQELDVMLQRLDQWHTEMLHNTSTSVSSDFSHASKTILYWLHESFNHWNILGTVPYIIKLLPRLFIMQEVNDDEDLQGMARKVLNLIAKVNYPPSMLGDMIEEFLRILKTSSSWHIRIRVLPVLQIFFFKNLFMMKSTELLYIMKVISEMLLDTQLEVRQLAAVTLSGLVRCSQKKDVIESLLKEFIETIETIKIPKRKIKEIKQETILKKHAGVLGLSCLINAYPYEVPEWMPNILCQLADCMSDPIAEIQATIRKTFSDFRRTHSDTWHEDSHKFNEDQLAILSDMLISPSYYA